MIRIPCCYHCQNHQIQTNLTLQDTPITREREREREREKEKKKVGESFCVGLFVIERGLDHKRGILLLLRYFGSTEGQERDKEGGKNQEQEMLCIASVNHGWRWL
ncbi:hypothetical protein ACJW31_05G020300 [Castanea mollissima]